MDLVLRLLWAGLWVWWGFVIYRKGGWWRASLGAVMMGLGTIGVVGYLFGGQ